MNSKTNKIWNLLIKVVLFFLLLYIIYRQVSTDGQGFQHGVDILFFKIKNLKSGYLILVVLLMPMNWLLESKRFQWLMSKFVSLTYIQSVEAILCGLSVASITPNRIGEYGGRIIALAPENNKYGLLATFAGSIAQNLTNLVFGMLGATYFLAHYFQFNNAQLISTCIVVLIFTLILCILYYRLDLLARVVGKISFIPYSRKIYRALEETQKLGGLLLSKVIFLSSLRYLVYLSQYVLMLYAFNIDIPLIAAISGVALIYLIQSGLPIPPLFGIVARGEIALLIWGVFVQDDMVILSVTLLLWIINLIVPSFIGLIIVNKIDILKSLGYNRTD